MPCLAAPGPQGELEISRAQATDARLGLARELSERRLRELLDARRRGSEAAAAGPVEADLKVHPGCQHVNEQRFAV